MTTSMRSAETSRCGRVARLLGCIFFVGSVAACSDASDTGSPGSASQTGGASGHVSAGGAAGEGVTGGASGSSNGGQSGAVGTGGASTVADAGGDAPGSGLVQPIQRGDLYELEFGKTTFVVDGTKGARITAFTLDGTNILTGPSVNAAFWG